MQLRWHSAAPLAQLLGAVKGVGVERVRAAQPIERRRREDKAVAGCARGWRAEPEPGEADGGGSEATDGGAACNAWLAVRQLATRGHVN